MDETPHDATEESLCCFLFTIYAGRVAYCTLYPVFGRELGLACKGVWFGCDGVDPLDGWGAEVSAVVSGWRDGLQSGESQIQELWIIGWLLAARSLLTHPIAHRINIYVNTNTHKNTHTSIGTQTFKKKLTHAQIHININIHMPAQPTLKVSVYSLQAVNRAVTLC